MKSLRELFARKRPVVIWGSGPNTPHVLRAVRDLGFTPRMVVAHRGGGIDGIPEVDSTRSIIRGDVPIIAGEAQYETGDQFLEIASETQRFGYRLFHPAVLCDHLTFSSKRLMLNGLPGSGNVITQTVVADLLSGKPTTFTETEAAFVHFASAYATTLRRVLGLEECVMPTTETIYGCFTCPPDLGFIAGLPLRGHVWSNGYFASHELPGEDMLALYRRAGFDVIEVIRHPLDIIVSIAGKMVREAGLDDPRIVLDNLAWFESMVETVTKYFTATRDAGDKIRLIVKYEDLLSDPSSSIGELAACAGVEIDEDGASEIWERHGFRPLQTERHYWRPGAGKWREFLTRRHVDIASHGGLAKIGKKFGYVIDNDLPPDREANPVPERSAHRLAQYDASLGLLLGRETTFQHPEIETLRAGYGVHCSGIRGQFSDAMSSPVAAAVVGAGQPL